MAPFTSRYASGGMVCAVDHLAASAGVDLLRRGGSAVDAAVGASAVLAVTAQHMCGMGGDLFALVHAGNGAPFALNASGRAGSGADPRRLRTEGHRLMPPRGDIRAVPVPGCVDGWIALHERFGRLGLGEVLEAARRYAEDGFPCSRGLAAVAGSVASLPGGADFARARAPGVIVRRPGVARALSAIVDGGRDGHYRGTFGAGLKALGAGEFSDEDLAEPLATWVEPLGIDALGARLWTIPPNSQGYLTLAGAYLAERLPLPDPDDPRWAHFTIEAARQAAHDRNDVLHEHADVDALLSPARLDARASAISADRAARLPGPVGAGGTISLCAVDSERMGVSLIQSNAGGFGAGIAEPETGIFLHNRGIGFSLDPGHPAEYGPRRRPPHTLSPALVTTTSGDLHTVLGTMGGDSQPQVLLQLLCRMLRADERVGDAVAAGRWVLSNARQPGGFGTWAPAAEIEVQLEETTPSTWPERLSALGHRVAPMRGYGDGFGHAHVISCRDGVLEGAHDPRSRAGAALGY